MAPLVSLRRSDAAARELIAQLRLLGELDVVDDQARPGGMQVAHHLGVQGALEGPLRLEVVEGQVVDTDDEKPLHGLRTADVEAGLERFALERLERAGLARPEGGGAGQQRNGTERGEAPASCHRGWGGSRAHRQRLRCARAFAR
jgi:hypothetical protein